MASWVKEKKKKKTKEDRFSFVNQKTVNYFGYNTYILCRNNYVKYVIRPFL